jgi:hypothetical protein
MVAHRLDLDGAQAGRIGDRGAGHAGKNHRADDVDLPQPAAHPADQRHREVIDAPGDAGNIHQVAGQDEEGHCQQGKAFDAGDHALRHDHVRHRAGREDVQQRRRNHRQRHRQSQQHQHQERAYQDAHYAAPVPS